MTGRCAGFTACIRDEWWQLEAVGSRAERKNYLLTWEHQIFCNAMITLGLRDPEKVLVILNMQN